MFHPRTAFFLVMLVGFILTVIYVVVQIGKHRISTTNERLKRLDHNEEVKSLKEKKKIWGKK